MCPSMSSRASGSAGLSMSRREEKTCQAKSQARTLRPYVRTGIEKVFLGSIIQIMKLNNFKVKLCFILLFIQRRQVQKISLHKILIISSLIEQELQEPTFYL